MFFECTIDAESGDHCDMNLLHIKIFLLQTKQKFTFMFNFEQ